MATSGVAIAAALYYGPKKALETWDWYRDRLRDNAVYIVLKKRKTAWLPPPLPIGGASLGNRSFPSLLTPQTQSAQFVEYPYTVPEIAKLLKRKEKSVTRSLIRLEHRGKAVRDSDGWRLKD